MVAEQVGGRPETHGRIIRVPMGSCAKHEAAHIQLLLGQFGPQHRDVLRERGDKLHSARPFVTLNRAVIIGEGDEHPFIKDRLPVKRGHALETSADFGEGRL